MDLHRVSKRRWLILLMETKARELHAKMLLGLVAAEQGWGVLLGSKSALRNIQRHLPRGMFFEKGVAPGTAQAIDSARTCGHRVSASCEEGLLYLNPDEYHERRIDPQVMAVIDYFFAWGARHATDVRAASERADDKVVNSGNPRFDLVRPEWRGIFARAAGDIRKRYGPIILLNTKFPMVNNIARTIGDYTDYLKSVGKVRSKEHEALIRRFAMVQQQVFFRMLDLVPTLARAFQSHTIIIRPHPSEDDAPWVERAKDLANVNVVFEGNVLEWITASDVVVQSNCITGIETFLLEKASISYRPVKDDEAEFELARRVGLQASTDAEAIALIQGVLSGEVNVGEQYLAQREIARPYIANMDDRLACEVIMETFNGLNLPLCEGAFPVRPTGISGLITGLMSGPVVRALLAYNRKKFPRLRLAEMEGLRADFQNVSGRFANVEITQATNDGFCLYRP